MILPKASPLQLILGISSIAILTFYVDRMFNLLYFSLGQNGFFPFVGLANDLTFSHACKLRKLFPDLYSLSRLIIPVCFDGGFLVDGGDELCLSDNVSPS